MSRITKHEILKLVKEYLRAQEALQRATRASSCTPSVVLEEARLRKQLNCIIKTEIHHDE